jgi:tagaturonate reductase
MTKILQFGGGNFIRCFFDWMIQKVADATGTDYRVTIVQPTPRGTARETATAALWYVFLRGYENGAYIEKLDRVGVIEKGINPFDDPSLFYACAEDPDYALIASNTTEAGIFYEHGHDEPHNYPSFLTAFLYKRMLYGFKPPLVLPLELIDRNGDNLRDTVMLYALEWNCGERFFNWFEDVKFHNTLVDRIVPGYPADAAERIWERLGHEDHLLSSCELFHLFVIEGGTEILRVIPFDKAGLNVVVTPDRLAFYRSRKVRVLNGCHTASAPVALYAGIEEVDKFAGHKKYGAWLNEMAHKEIAFAMGDTSETHDYANGIIERLRNPVMGHKFRSIALNSIAKSNTRLRPTLEDYYTKTGVLPRHMTKGIRAMVRLYSCGPINENLPGGPLELPDYKDLGGASQEDILESMFPGLDGRIMEGLRNELCR